MKALFTIFLAMCLLTSAGVLTASAEEAVITAVSFDNASAVAEENLSVSGYGDKDSGYAASTTGGRLFASVSGTDLRKLEWSKGEYGTLGMQPVMTGGTKNPWGNGAYIEVRLSTSGYEDITFSADLGATKKGPRDYKLQYSIDGETFRDVTDATYTVKVNKELATAFDHVALPAQANDCERLHIRIAVASNMLVNGTAGLIGSTGGETAINNVTVSGVKMAVSTPTEATTATTAFQNTVTSTTVNTAVNETTAASSTTTVTVAAASQTTAPPSAHTADASHVAVAVVLLAISAAATLLLRKRHTT